MLLPRGFTTLHLMCMVLRFDSESCSVPNVAQRCTDHIRVEEAALSSSIQLLLLHVPLACSIVKDDHIMIHTGSVGGDPARLTGVDWESGCAARQGEVLGGCSARTAEQPQLPSILRALKRISDTGSTAGALPCGGQVCGGVPGWPHGGHAHTRLGHLHVSAPVMCLACLCHSCKLGECLLQSSSSCVSAFSASEGHRRA